MAKNSVTYVIGVDVGGTNTDTAILCGNTVIAKAKRPTTEDKTNGITNSIQAALESLPEDTRATVLDKTARVSIGTTHFTNAIKERDAKNLKKVAVIRICGSASRGLPPFIDFPEDLYCHVYGGRYMVSGGLEYNAVEISPMDADEIRACVREMLAQDPPVKNLVISGVFAPCDNRQEKEAEAIVRAVAPDISCTLSHELGMLGILERENAAILNESLRPLAAATIVAFRDALVKLQIKCPFYLTQNDGTLISHTEAIEYPVLTFSSGPTNSMRGAAFLSGLSNAIVVDIGGTTTDVGVLRKGFPREASTQCMVGDVRTNFSMPDVQSIALGGGSHVEWNSDTRSVVVGPESVGYRITEDALCFGGQACTATDVAIAAGVAPSNFCRTPEALVHLNCAMVYSTMRAMRRMLETVIDRMKVEKEDVPVILVGGGCILVDRDVPLRGASCVVSPKEHWDVANAVGAALGTVGGSVDRIEELGPIVEQLKVKGVKEAELESQAREVVRQRGIKIAKEEAAKKGAHPSTIEVYREDVTDITYVTGRVRVKVKAIGSLTTAQEEVARPAPAPVVPLDSQQIQAVQLSKDNPHWPNSSAEDRSKDDSANLPSPNVQGGVWKLSAHDIECLATGAGILGCGGGGDPNLGRLMGLKLLGEGKEIKIVNPCRVKATEMGLVSGVAFMGAPIIEVEKLVNGEETSIALDRLQRVLASGVCEGVEEGRVGGGGVEVVKKTCSIGDSQFPNWLANDADLERIDMSDGNVPLKRRVTALMCCEVGGCNSMEPLLVGARTGLPVMDADGMGRAFPELQMFLPFINGASHNPSTLADNKGEVITCTHVGLSLELENFFRVETVRMGMCAAIALGAMPYEEFMEKSVLFSMSQAWQLGRAVTRARAAHINIVQAVADQQRGMVLITGKIISVDKILTAGFSRVAVVVEGLDKYAGYQVKVLTKNENYIAQSQELDVSSGKAVDGPVLACTPDLITIIDSDTGVPITTDHIRYGLRVGVVVLPANPMWKTEKALKVVDPRAFGFDIPYREPRPLLGD